MNHALVAEKAPPSQPALLPLPLQVPVPSHLFGGGAFSMTLHAGLTVLLGPNGTGKTHVLRALAWISQTQASRSTKIGCHRGILVVRSIGSAA
jgi:hypothetical protein